MSGNEQHLEGIAMRFPFPQDATKDAVDTLGYDLAEKACKLASEINVSLRSMTTSIVRAQDAFLQAAQSVEAFGAVMQTYKASRKEKYLRRYERRK